MSDRIRILLVADTHLGFDLPVRPRVTRRRRGPDFFERFQDALAPALRGEVDLVVHGGDLLFRSKVRPSLVLAALEPLFAVADAGVPVFIVPGNHERSAIPYALLARRERIHVFDSPRTFRLEIGGLTVALSGFPYVRDGVRDRFTEVLDRCAWREGPADVRLLCMHQIVAGATVGPVGYMFRGAADVIRGRQIPTGFAAVLSGHIHRAQVLRADLSGRPLAAPVYYPGSVERTSFAEKDETKGFYLIDARSGDGDGGEVCRAEFRGLDARPMAILDLDATGLSRAALESALQAATVELAPDAVARIRIVGEVKEQALPALRAAAVRRLIPPTMNLDVAFPRQRRSPSTAS
jgi:DNA repair exonuclease SbcCD nuclease subunit